MAEWAREVVLPVIIREGEVSKADLQDKTGLGAEDLREAIAELEEAGEIRATAEGWERGEPDEAAREESIAELEGDGQREEPEVEGAADSAGQAPDPTTYRSQILLEVEYHNEPTVEEADREESAVADAHRIRELAVAGIRERYPDLSIRSAVDHVEAYGQPRRIYDGRG